MARPRKEGLDYFPHDVGTLKNIKLKALVHLHGIVAYAWYFITLEFIYGSKKFEIDISDDDTVTILSKELGMSKTKYLAILDTALKKDLFDRKRFKKTQKLTSPGIKKRAKVVTDKRKNEQKKYEKKNKNTVLNENFVSASEMAQETNPETEQRKEKKNKKTKG